MNRTNDTFYLPHGTQVRAVAGWLKDEVRDEIGTVFPGDGDGYFVARFSKGGWWVRRSEVEVVNA